MVQPISMAGPTYAPSEQLYQSPLGVWSFNWWQLLHTPAIICIVTVQYCRWMDLYSFPSVVTEEYTRSGGPSKIGINLECSYFFYKLMPLNLNNLLLRQAPRSMEEFASFDSCSLFLWSQAAYDGLRISDTIPWGPSLNKLSLKQLD